MPEAASGLPPGIYKTMKRRYTGMGKFVTIGERLSTTAPAVNKAFTERDPEPILKRAKQQLDAGATYLDVNIGPAENRGLHIYGMYRPVQDWRDVCLRFFCHVDGCPAHCPPNLTR